MTWEQADRQLFWYRKKGFLFVTPWKHQCPCNGLQLSMEASTWQLCGRTNLQPQWLSSPTLDLVMVSQTNRPPSAARCHGARRREEGEVARLIEVTSQFRINRPRYVRGSSALMSSQKKKPDVTRRRWAAHRRAGVRREKSDLCFLSQAMTWLIVLFWSNFGTWKTAHLSWRKMMCCTVQMEISSPEKD